MARAPGAQTRGKPGFGIPGPERACRRRARRDVRQLPHRLRVELEGSNCLSAGEVHRRDRERAVIRALIRASVRHRLLVVMLTVAAAGVGLFALRRIPIDAIPDLSATEVIVFSRWDRS